MDLPQSLETESQKRQKIPTSMKKKVTKETTVGIILNIKKKSIIIVVPILQIQRITDPSIVEPHILR